MKYVRTADGRIIDTEKKYQPLQWAEQARDYALTIAQADTIEELCDEFIDEETKTIFHKHNGYVINWKTNLVYSLKELVKEFHSIKGAIYTDKGLIYVAKLNDRGELELI